MQDRSKPDYLDCNATTPHDPEVVEAMRPFPEAECFHAEGTRVVTETETAGLMKALVGTNDDSILGFGMHGIQGGDIAGAMQIAMMGALAYTAIRDGAFAHPTPIWGGL